MKKSKKKSDADPLNTVMPKPSIELTATGKLVSAAQVKCQT